MRTFFKFRNRWYWTEELNRRNRETWRGPFVTAADAINAMYRA